MPSLEQRVAALEERLGVESSARASSDRDLSELTSTVRAMRHLVQALSITQSEHTDVLARLETATGRLDVGVHRILELLENMQ